MKILIVEDDSILQQLFAKQVEIHRHEATAFEDAESALEVYKLTFYPLIIVDLGLPEMDGLELCRHIRSLPWGKKSMILVVTGRDRLEDVQTALDAGADDYLIKPITRTALDVRLTVIERRIRTLTEYQQEVPKLRLFRELIEQANDGVFIIDPKTAMFLDVNNTACQNLGYTRQELLNMNISNIAINFPTLSSWKQYVNNLREKREMLLEDEYRSKEGTNLPVESNMALATQEGQEYIVAVVRTVTERKQL